MKYSSLAYGVALGLCAVAVVGGLVTLAGGTPQLAALVWLFAFAVGLVPVLEAGIDLLRLYRSDRLTERDRELKQMEVAARLALLNVPVPSTVTEDGHLYDDGSFDEALKETWYGVLRQFYRNGEIAAGFSHRKLEGTLTEKAWTELTTFYASDAGGRVLRLTADGYVLGYGWEHDTVRQVIERRQLPCPSGVPPVVSVLPDGAMRRDARRRATASKSRVVDS